ncbi:MAG: site-specific integrase [Clostridia bacterium]|nr:site-specific integrase [Clostridia bacterium]
MGKSKSLGFQIHSALAEINLQDKDKRTEIFNKENNTHYKTVGKREFKQNKTSINYIFSKRSAENITEKSKAFTKFLKETYNVKMVRDITPQMCIAFLDTKQGCSSKTISAYKNALEKISLACSQKFHIQGFYTEDVRTHKVVDTYKTNSSRLYTNEQIEKIYNFESKRQAEIKCMCFLGCRVFEMIGIKAEDINITKHIYTTTTKDGKIDTYNTVKIIGKGGKLSYRPILPQYRSFFQELIKGKQSTEKVFDLPKNEKMARLTMSNEIRRITKELGIAESGKNHEFRKYHCQLAVEYYVSNGWSREKAETFVIQRHLSHSGERQDLKKIYLYS